MSTTERIPSSADQMPQFSSTLLRVCELPRDNASIARSFSRQIERLQLQEPLTILLDQLGADPNINGVALAAWSSQHHPRVDVIVVQIPHTQESLESDSPQVEPATGFALDQFVSSIRNNFGATSGLWFVGDSGRSSQETALDILSGIYKDASDSSDYPTIFTLSSRS